MKPVIVCLISLFLIFNVSFASFPNAENLFRGANSDFVTKIDSNMGDGLKAILLLVYKIGYALAVSILLVIAIKLILATPAKKAEMKEGLLPYLIGLLLLIAGVPLAIMVIENLTLLFP